jgi:hypothetical protein
MACGQCDEQREDGAAHCSWCGDRLRKRLVMTNPDVCRTCAESLPDLIGRATPHWDMNVTRGGDHAHCNRCGAETMELITLNGTPMAWMTQNAPNPPQPDKSGT